MTLVIGHIALIQRTKKQDFVLGVMEQLKKEGFDVVGLFAGEVREPDYLEELTRMAAEKGLGDRAVFLGRRNDIPDLLQVMDLLMIPSSFEGFPLAGLEAAAAGGAGGSLRCGRGGRICPGQRRRGHLLGRGRSRRGRGSERDPPAPGKIPASRDGFRRRNVGAAVCRQAEKHI